MECTLTQPPRRLVGQNLMPELQRESVIYTLWTPGGGGDAWWIIMKPLLITAYLLTGNCDTGW